ncbi:LysR family transcriptional regulator [Paenibacillus sp. y28]|uniref:LysR family transcriptional regulator n=1 Tax=Paenibacillus sp. y28 TaxID=3129110 RepID=UPI0030158C00
MELRQLTYTVQIAQEKNFSRAAEKLHIAQPSLSQQLSKLEKEIGVLLFRRSTNSVELTHAGALFVDRAQKIIDMVGQLKKEMEDISQMRKGRLSVGSLPMTGAHILPLVLPVFQARYPEIEIALVEETSANLEALTASGQTDISLLSLPLEENVLSYESIIEEEICLAIPPQHRLAAAGCGPVELAELAAEPFIVLKQGQGFRQIALDLCAQAGFAPDIVFESSNIETVQSLVAAGMGIAFVPQMVARSKGSPLAPSYLSLSTRPTRTLVIAYRQGRYLSKAAEAFMSVVREVIKSERH